MTYGTNTRSYNRSPEKREMDLARKDATDRYLGLCFCGAKATALCAWKVPVWQRMGQSSDRCEVPLCAAHAKKVAEDKHLCREHSERYEEWKRKKNQQGSLFA